MPVPLFPFCPLSLCWNRYFGRPAHTAQIDALHVFVTGAELCSPTRAFVEGKVIFTDLNATPCTLTDIYAGLDAAAAAAFVYIGPYNPPGLLCYLHHYWEADMYANSGTLMVRSLFFMLFCSSQDRIGESYYDPCSQNL